MLSSTTVYLQATTLPNTIRVLVIENGFGGSDDITQSLRKMSQFKADITRTNTLDAAGLMTARMAFDVYLIDATVGADCCARLVQDIEEHAETGVPILLKAQTDRPLRDNALCGGAINCINRTDLSPTLLETTIRYALCTHRVAVGVSRLARTLSGISSQRADERH
jgi:hypothetical protein